MKKSKANLFIYWVVAILLPLLVCEGLSHAAVVLTIDNGSAAVQPFDAGWTNEIVVMPDVGQYSSGYDTSSLPPGTSPYFNFTWKNESGAAIGQHTAYLYITFPSVGEFLAAYSVSGGLAAGAWSKLGSDLQLRDNLGQPIPFQIGTYQIKVVIRDGGFNLSAPEINHWYRDFTVASDGQAHLRPSKPPQLSDIIVVAMTSDAAADDPAIYVNETAYLNFAWYNLGDTRAAAGSYTAELEVDGQPVYAVPVDQPTDAGKFVVQRNWAHVFTTAGDHTVELIVQGDGDPVEYTYARTISVQGDVVNLKPFAPSGWSLPIIVSNTSGDQNDEPPVAGQDVYIDISWQNTCTETQAASHDTVLYVDDVEIYRATQALDPNNHIKDVDTVYNFATPGTYTVKMVVDDGTDVGESNEADNVYERTITVQAATGKTYSLITTATTSVNAIVLCRAGTGYTKASHLFAAVPNINALSRWNAGLQAYESYIPVINDFDLTVGEPYFVSVSAPGTFTVSGSIPTLSFNLITTSSTNVNAFSLPVSKSSLSLASELFADISNADALSIWNASLQAYESYIPIINDFAVSVDEAYFISVSSATIWP